MLTLAFRGVSAAVAAGLLIAAGLWTSSPDDASVPLGAVLHQTTSAKTLHMVVYRPDEPAGGKAEKKTDVWARRGGQLRVDEGSGKYTIAAGPKLWRIDEKANQATAATSPYFVDDKSDLDLLALLDLPELENRQALFDQRPAETIRRDDRDFLIYRGSCPSRLGPIQMEVTVDATTQLLESIEATGVRQGQETMLGRLVLVSIDEPVDEELFVVGDTLTEDGRIGKVTTRRGLSPSGRSWTSDGRRLPADSAQAGRLAADRSPRGERRLRSAGTRHPGDARPRLAGRDGEPKQIRVARGELKVVVQGKPVGLVGPDAKPSRVKDTRCFASITKSSCAWKRTRSGSRASRARLPTSRSARWWPTSTAATCR